MKKHLPLLAFAALMLVVASCSLFKKDIDVPQDFSLYIDRPENASANFSVAETIDTHSGDIEKYKSDIDEFKIDKITFTVSSYSGTPAAALSANLQFAAEGSSDYKTLGTINNVNLKSMSDSGQEMSVTISDATAKNELVNMMKGGNMISFRLDGATSAIPVATYLNFKIYANMTVSL